MEIIKLYINLNTCLVDLQNNQNQQNVLADQCDDYFNCVKRNSHLIEQYKSLSPEILNNFVNQDFDINELSLNFERFEAIDLKIRKLLYFMPEIRNYMKTESANIELEVQHLANDLNFEQMDDAEEWLDSVSYELERRKQERIDNMEKWKSAGKAVLKYAAIVIGLFFTFLWRMIDRK